MKRIYVVALLLVLCSFLKVGLSLFFSTNLLLQNSNSEVGVTGAVRGWQSDLQKKFLIEVGSGGDFLTLELKIRNRWEEMSEREIAYVGISYKSQFINRGESHERAEVLEVVSTISGASHAIFLVWSLGIWWLSIALSATSLAIFDGREIWKLVGEPKIDFPIILDKVG